MSRLAFRLQPIPAASGSLVRIDTASGSNTPADLRTLGGNAIDGAIIRSGSNGGHLPVVLGPDGVTTLYQKVLDYRGQVTGTPVTLTGEDDNPSAPTYGGGTSASLGLAPSGDVTGATDSAALQALITAATSRGGDTVRLQSGTFWLANVVIYSGVRILGAGYGNTTVKLPAGSTADMFVSQGFAGLTGTTSLGGIVQFQISDLALDGNKANAPSGGRGIAVFARDFTLSNLRIRNFASWGLWTEYGNFGALNPDGMEAFVDNLECTSNTGGGIYWNVHDSLLQRVVCANNGNRSIKFGPVASGTQCVAHHYWGVTAPVHIETDGGAGSVQFSDCQAEGAPTVQVLALGNQLQWIGGKIFNPVGGNTSRGIQIGDSTHGPGGFRVDTQFENVKGGAIDFTYDTGKTQWITGRVYSDTATPVYVGTPDAKARVHLIADGSATGGLNQNGPIPVSDSWSNGGNQPPAATVDTMDRLAITASNNMASGDLVLTYFTPNESVTSTQVTYAVGTGVVAPTLQKMGLYSVASNGALTLLTSWSDTAAGTTNGSTVTKSWAASQALARGQRYAIGYLQVGATTAPTIKGAAVSVGAILSLPPVAATHFTGQTDLPASISSGSPTNNTLFNFYRLS